MTTSTMKLLLIDGRVPDIETIISSLNDSTACLVFNYYHDTPETLLSKIRFLNRRNRVIRENFLYDEPSASVITDLSNCTTCDASGNPKQFMSASDIALRAMEYALANGNSGSVSADADADVDNTSPLQPPTPWTPSFSDNSMPTPVFFQRLCPVTDASGTTIMYREQLPVMVSDLDEIYNTFKTIPYESSPYVYSDTHVVTETEFSSVGIIQHAYMMNGNATYTFLKMINAKEDAIAAGAAEGALLTDVMSIDPNLLTWQPLVSTLTTILTRHQSTTLDLMACAIYADPNWKYVIDELERRMGITIRASTDNTGASAMGGNWILETDNVNLKDVYFTDGINSWSHLLAIYTAYDGFVSGPTAQSTSNNWQYFEIDSTRSTASLLSNWQTGNEIISTYGQWDNNRTGGNYPFIQKVTGTGTINTGYNTSITGPALVIHPDDSANGNIGIGYKNTTASTISVAVDISLSFLYPGNNSDGVNYYVQRGLVNDARYQSYASSSIPATSSSVYTFNNTNVDLQSGEIVYLIVNRNGIYYWDHLRLGFSINTTFAPVPTFGTFTIPTKTYGTDVSFNITAPSSNSTGAFTYSSSNTAVATISSSTVTIVGAGTSTITATQASDANYSSSSVSAVLTVNAAVPTFGTFTLGSKSGSYALTDVSFSLTAPTSNSSGTFTFASDNSGVATVTNASPSSATTSNLLARYDASVATSYTVSGSNVTQWNDLTGNGYHLTANGTGPTLTTLKTLNAFNFSPGYGFIRNSVPLSTQITLFMVGTYKYASNQWGNFMHHGDHDYDWSLRKSFYSDYVNFHSNNDNYDVQLLMTNNVNYIWIGRIVGNTRQFWAYSDTQSARYISGTPVTITAGNKTLYVGKSDVGASEACNSVIGEILYYNASLSNADVSANLLYLQNKWFNNITSSPITYVNLVANGTANISATQQAYGNYTSKTVSSLLTVGGQSAPTFGTFTVASTKTYGDASFAIITRPTSNSPGAITYTSNSTSVATIDTSGNWITLVGAGSVTFTATQDASGGYASGSVTSNTLTVSLGTSTFSASTFSIPSNKSYGDASFAITTRPSSNSGGAVTYASSNTSVATIDTSGNWITLVGAGDVSFNATQAATSQYASATKTSNTLTVALGTPTLSSTTFSVSSTKTYGDASFAITTRPTSNSSGAITYTSSNTSVATIDTCGNWITLVGAGDVSFNASQAAVPNQFTSASKTSNTLTVALGTSTFSASTFSIPSNKSYGDASFAITTRPSSNSGGAVTYASSNTSVATIDTSGNWITLVGAGDVSFNATQAATSQYASATKTSNTLTVALGTPTLSSTTFSVSSTKTYGDASFAITTRPTSNSSGAITYTSSNTSVATIDTCGNWITLVGAGDVSFNASQAAVPNQFTSASKTSNTLTVALGTSTFSASTFSIPSNKSYGDASFAITTRPSSNSGGAVTYTSSNTSVATIDTCGNWITLVGAGDVSFNASQAATSQYASATKTSNTLTVALGTPTLSSTTFSVSSTKTYGDASFAITTRPTSNSAGEITYTSSNTSVATIDTCGNWITLVGAGDVSFNASQVAVPNQFTSASKTSNTLTVALGTSTFSASTFSIPSNKSYGDASFAITTRPSSNSGGAVTYTSSNTSVATIDTCGNWITLVGAGDVSFNASQAATSQYASATKTSNTLTVALGTPTLSSTTFSVSSTKTYGDASFAITTRPTSNSAGEITYTSSNTSVATIDTCGNWITLVGAGDVSFNASQVAVPNQFTSASKTSNTLTVALGTSTFSASTFSIPSNKSYGDASFAITTRPSSNSGGAVTYTSSNTSVATIDTCGNWITLVGAGDVSFNASQAATSQYASATKTSNTLTVALGTPTLSSTTFSVSSTKTYGDASFAITTRPTSNSAGEITYTSSNTSVATIDTCGNWITLVGAGDVSFNASQAAVPNQFTSASKTSNTLTVALGTSTFSASTFSVASSKTYGDASFAITTRPSSNSGGAVTYTSSNTSVATIDTCGNWITLVGAGDVSFNASQAATSQYASATKTSNTLTVALGTPTLSSTTFSVSSTKTYGDASFAITTRPTSNSSGEITYSSSNTSVATIDTCGNWITLVGAGDVSFNASQAAVPNQFTSATKTSNTLTVALGTSTFSASTFSVASSKTYGDASFAIITRPSSNSGGAVTYTSSNTSVAIIDTSGNWITIVAAGDVSFNATQAATSQYASATNTSNTLTVSLATPTLSSSTFSIASSKTYGDASFAITTRPTSDSSGAITYSSSNTSVATIDACGNWITLVGAGDVTFTATQAATNQYASASKTSNTLTVGLGTSTFSASTFSIPSTKAYGDASFAITTRPSSNSGGAVTYTSSNTSVATIDTSGNWITLVGAGDVSFNAAQAETSQYASATKTSNTLTVSLGTPTLSSTTFSVASSKAYGDASFAITTRPTSNSSGAITYTSNNTSVATIDTCGNWISLVGAGDVSFNVSQAAVPNQFISASNTSNTLTVSLGTPTLSTSTFSVASSKAYGDASFAITTRPTSNSSGAITYTSSNTSVATIDACGNWINIIAPGDVSFNATQAAVANQFIGATKTSNTLTVSKATVALTFANPPTTKNVTDAAFTVTASSASPGAVTYTSSNTSFATVESTTGLVTLRGAGTVTITAAQESTEFYNAPTNATCSIVISPAGSTLAGQTVSPSTNFSGVDLSGASFSGSTLSGVSFSGATLTNVNFSGAVITGTDFTNANISGATNLPDFSTVQKLQLLKNINNVEITEVQVSSVTGDVLVSALSNPIAGIEDLTFSVVVPTTLDASANKTLTLTSATIASSNIYLPVNTSDIIKINGVIYRSNGTNILDANNEVVNFISIDGVPFRVYAGSFVGINTLSSLNSLKVNGSGVYDTMKSVYLLTSGSNAGAGSALPSNTIAALNATKINGDGLYDILNGLLQNL